MIITLFKCLNIKWGHYKFLKVTWQMKHKHFKNPNWWEAYQLAVYEHGRGFQHRTTVKQIQVVRATAEQRIFLY